MGSDGREDETSGAASSPLDPITESRRLAELRDYGILQRSGDAIVDEVTRLATELFQMPVALVSIIDADYQYLLSNCGLEDLDGKPRSHSFCTRTIAHESVMVVADTHADSRFAHHPLVVEPPHIRFYAGAVLRTPAGYPLGSLCIKDYAPRDFGDSERHQLTRLARIVAASLCSRAQTSPHSAPAHAPGLDASTGLPRQAAVYEHLESLLAAPGPPAVSVLVIHVDGLFDLRSTLGSPPVESLLAALAERFQAALPRQAELGRWGTAELMAILPPIPDIDPESVAQALAEAAAAPVTVQGSAFRRSLSIGVATAQAPTDTAETLADRALAAAWSQLGRHHAGSRLALDRTGEAAQRRVELVPRLARAIGDGRIVAHFQPRLCTRTRRVVAAEALARWDDPELGTITPREFVPIAERAGLTGDLTALMLEQAVRWGLYWRRHGDPAFRVAVNLSGAELLDDGIIAQTQRVLERHAAPGDLLEFEVTEGALIGDVELAAARMLALGALGVRFAIDDFGTGYSSFTYLQSLPVHQLKIDRSFIADLTEDVSEASIVQAICAMAHALGMETVAEGVEHAEQLIFLKAYHCSQMQGFVFAPAVPPDKMLGLIHAARRESGGGDGGG